MKRWLAVALALALPGCGGGSPAAPTTPTPPTPPVAADAVVVAAGDIGWCGVPEPEATAKLLDVNPGQVVALGDIAYPNGSAADIQNCYQPNWGRHKGRTRPVPGNHDYVTPNASAYFAYFGAAAGAPGRGYYSYNLESWHVVALDSNVDMGASSAQFAWLIGDLQANPSACTVAYWHHPLFASGPSQGHTRSRDVWRVLYEAGADLVLVGDDHAYERFAPQDPDGRFDSTLGIRQFIVGTGGAPLYDVARLAANSEVRSKTHGVLRLTLKTGKYDWEFIPIAGQSFRDSGSGSCH
jgi:acid phosphatase type 7